DQVAVHVRLRHAPRRRRFGTPRAQRRARDPARCGATDSTAALAQEGRRPATLIAGRHGRANRSQPISRVLLRRAGKTRYDRHSSRRRVATALEPPTRGLGEQRRRPHTWCCSGWRLPRFTRILLIGCDSSLWPCSSPSPPLARTAHSGWALPIILLCGARTFLSRRSCLTPAATVWLTSRRYLITQRRRRLASARSPLHIAGPALPPRRRPPPGRSRPRGGGSPCRRCAAGGRSRRRESWQRPRAGRARPRPRTPAHRARARRGPSNSPRSRRPPPSPTSRGAPSRCRGRTSHCPSLPPRATLGGASRA